MSPIARIGIDRLAVGEIPAFDDLGSPDESRAVGREREIFGPIVRMRNEAVYFLVLDFEHAGLRFHVPDNDLVVCYECEVSPIRRKAQWKLMARRLRVPSDLFARGYIERLRIPSRYDKPTIRRDAEIGRSSRIRNFPRQLVGVDVPTAHCPLARHGNEVFAVRRE